MKHLMTIATLGSHSALEICRGAKDEGFRTLVVCQKGREQTYARYYATRETQGCVDECMVLERFSDLLTPSVQKTLKEKNCVFVPHRSFEAYLGFDYDAIEQRFTVPVFGNKYLLKIEERGKHPNQYDLLREAGIRYPKQFSDPSAIDRLVIVKVNEKERPWERAFFLTNNARMKNPGKHAVIEEFIVGVPVNFHFFYSPVKKRLELLGTDTRRQTNIEGVSRLPARYQEAVIRMAGLSFEEAGHIAATVLESMLEEAFLLGERFVAATKKLVPRGIIGPFALQTVITPGPPKKDIIVIDVSPRMPGSPGIAATPYSSYLFAHPVSMGRRIAMELREAVRYDRLRKLVT